MVVEEEEEEEELYFQSKVYPLLLAQRDPLVCSIYRLVVMVEVVLMMDYSLEMEEEEEE